MEASGVWRNLLAGKQSVATVACPACGAEVPEFRIHSHLDACLAALGGDDAGENGAGAGGGGGDELGGGAERSHRGRGRGRGRKRKGGDGEAGRKRGRRDGDVGTTEEKEVVDADERVDEIRDEYASFYQRWEYSVAGMEELGEARKESRRLCASQKRELFSCGVLTVERSTVSAMVSQLDRLLGEFETTTESAAAGQDGARSDHQGKALETWWEQWATVEWPEGPLPSEFHAGLPPRLESELHEDVHIEVEEEVGMERFVTHETAAVYGPHTTVINSVLNFNQSGGIIGGTSGVVPRSSEVLTKFGRRRGAVEVGVQSGPKPFRGEGSIPTALESHSSPNVERSTVADSLGSRRSGLPSPPRALVTSSAEAGDASPGLQACPICNRPFPPDTSNREINEHIDQCLAEMACQFD